ncbi:MAG: hypothetical protein EFT35_03140 [Methanophagales archaeon ANME-1-THS]|nr:MAG: hypothetical protein EFT35_03140 [Methanophagales archaeon ANME-1-THS]
MCGITADGMAMRMMLLRNLMGASTYHYHTDQTVKTLRATAALALGLYTYVNLVPTVTGHQIWSNF